MEALPNGRGRLAGQESGLGLAERLWQQRQPCLRPLRMSAACITWSCECCVGAGLSGVHRIRCRRIAIEDRSGVWPRAQTHTHIHSMRARSVSGASQCVRAAQIQDVSGQGRARARRAALLAQLRARPKAGGRPASPAERGAASPRGPSGRAARRSSARRRGSRPAAPPRCAPPAAARAGAAPPLGPRARRCRMLGSRPRGPARRWRGLVVESGESSTLGQPEASS